VRLLFNHLNRTVKQFVKHPKKVSIDEGIIKYFGPHPCKQFNRGKPLRFGYKVWIMASDTGELLACQPYGGAATHIEDYGLGQGPNVVLGLVEEYGPLPGTKVYVDNLFTSMDLLDAMGDKQLGLTGTLCLNRLHGIPLPTKKESSKLKRGEHRSVNSMDSTVVLWLDNKPVYMASNVDQEEPVGMCQRYNRKERRYVGVPQPAINSEYNKAMGGVDLLDNSIKNYAISTRVRKWYWAIYTWFLNVCMVQAWRLFRAFHKEKSKLQQQKEKEEDARWEEEMEDSNLPRATVEEDRKERMKEKRRRRAEEKKLVEMPLLEFTRQVVDLTFWKHGAGENEVTSQRAATARLTATTLAEVRFDSGRHLPLVAEVRGVCRVCKKRSTYRCTRCDVALHTDLCFYKWHVPENEWMEGIE